jgi:hypothetical protein
MKSKRQVLWKWNVMLRTRLEWLCRCKYIDCKFKSHLQWSNSHSKNAAHVELSTKLYMYFQFASNVDKQKNRRTEGAKCKIFDYKEGCCAITRISSIGIHGIRLLKFTCIQLNNSGNVYKRIQKYVQRWISICVLKCISNGFIGKTQCLY